MMAILLIFITIVIAFILYSAIQSELPEFLQIGDGTTPLAQVIEQVQGPAAVDARELISAQQWQVQSDGVNVSINRKFQGSIEANGLRYEAPVLNVLCYKNNLYARVQMLLAPASPATVEVDGIRQTWSVGSDRDVYSPAPADLIAVLKRENPVELVLPYAELGAQAVLLKTDGFRAASKALTGSCSS